MLDVIFDVLFGHRFSQYPVDEIETTAIQQAAEEIKGAAQIDMRHVNMPVLIGFERRDKAGPFFAGFTVSAP